MNLTPKQKAHRRADEVFRSILPQQGLAVRENQILLCHQMLDTLFGGEIALCDAGVGIGKTHAYLLACVLWQKYAPDAQGRSVTISTSSIALQEAILREYLPQLSDILLRCGIVNHPLTATVRKGKQHFVCDIRLAERLAALQTGSPRGSRKLQALNRLLNQPDLDMMPNLSDFDHRLVCVPDFCAKDCAGYRDCQYHRYLKSAMNKHITFQICNHNYLLADADHRMRGLAPLLQDGAALIVDEAHKLPEAVRQMYSRAFSSEDAETLVHLLEREHYTRTAQCLRENFRVLLAAFARREDGREPQAAYTPTPAARAALAAALRFLHQTARNLGGRLPRHLLHRLEESAALLELFRQNDSRYVLYIQYTHTGQPALCAADRRIPAQLDRALWQSKRPVILTSGTLAAGENFDRPKQTMGLDRCSKVKTYTALSPFDYQHNCLLYLPSGYLPHPGSSKEPAYLAEQITALADATHGHGLVLFTSYRLMDEVHRQIKGKLPYATLQAWRGGQRVVREFKALPNAVLFAAGPCWEGMDFPGDTVSLLVIARLPFPIPDALSEAEKAEYPSLQAYIQAAVVPEMQKKLRQGFGRAIRTETDTCVVSLLDQRAAPGGRYHAAALQALPPCPQTDSLEDVCHFIRARKRPDYFFPEGGNR